MGITTHICTVIENTEIASGIYSLIVKTPQAAEAKCGQFVNIYCEGKTLRRPISICEIDNQSETLRLVYQVKGEGTKWMSRVKSGQTLDILGPLGHGFSVDKAKKVVFVGGGIGTPPLLEAAKQCGTKPDAILGFRNKDLAILIEDFNKYCDNVLISTDDGSLGHHGFVITLLEQRLQSDCDLICACGPRPMLKAVAEIAEERGIECQVSLEERMGCGIGACLVCVCKVTSGKDDSRYAQVCRYGPVINSKEVVW